MAYPQDVTRHVTKIDENASGWYISPEYFNIPSSSPYTMYLDHIPRDSGTTTISASGGAAWTEVFVTPTATTQYYITYTTGQVEFHSSDAGAAVDADYHTLGDDYMAEHVNTVQAEIYNTQTELGHNPRGVSPTVSDRLNAMELSIITGVAASGINGDRIIDDTVRAGALKDDIKGSSWAADGGPVLTDITDHIADTTGAHASTAISASGLGATSITTVQGHINSVGILSASDSNPHGIGLSDALGDSDLYLPQGLFVRSGIDCVTLSPQDIVASGNYISLQNEGPNSDQYLYFYHGTPDTEYLRWNSSDVRFELTEKLYIHGVITASGNISPDASGARSVGTQAVAFSEVNAGTVRGDIGYFTDLYVGNGTLYIGAVALTANAVGELEMSSNLSPDSSGSRSVGSAEIPWAAGIFDEVNGGSYKTGDSTGAAGSFVAQSGETVTVLNGLVVSII